MTLRDKIIAEIRRVYYATERKGTMAEDMADAVLKLMERK